MSKIKTASPIFRGIASFALKLLGIYLALIAVMFLLQRSLVYNPSQNINPLSSYGIEKTAQEITTITDDNLDLTGWYFPPKSPDKATILFLHGNGGNIAHRLTKISPLVNARYGVLLAGYRGYGNNPGEPSESGLYDDAQNWFEALAPKTNNIVLYGESLGTGVAVEIATRYDVKGVILETPFARLADPAQEAYPFIPFIPFLLKDKFNSIDKIKDINAPVLFLLARNDEVVGLETGKALYDAALRPKTLKIFENGSHNTLLDHGSTATVLEFLDGLEDKK